MTATCASCGSPWWAFYASDTAEPLCGGCVNYCAGCNVPLAAAGRGQRCAAPRSGLTPPPAPSAVPQRPDVAAARRRAAPRHLRRPSRNRQQRFDL